MTSVKAMDGLLETLRRLGASADVIEAAERARQEIAEREGDE